MMAGKPAPQPTSKSKPDHAGVQPQHKLTGGRDPRYINETKQNDATGTGTGSSVHIP